MNQSGNVSGAGYLRALESAAQGPACGLSQRTCAMPHTLRPVPKDIPGSIAFAQLLPGLVWAIAAGFRCLSGLVGKRGRLFASVKGSMRQNSDFGCSET